VNTVRVFKRLESIEFRREINTALWVPAFDNAGQPDAGWSCRDHAGVVAMLLRCEGMQTFVVNGRAAFFGSERSTLVLTSHSWAFALELGVWDLSVKAEYAQNGMRVALSPVAGGRVSRHRGGRVHFTNDTAEFDALLGSDANAMGLRAVYLDESLDKITTTYVESPAVWINSPLTDRLIARYGRANYAGLVLHLRGIVDGTQMPLASRGQEGMWEALEKSYPSPEAKLLKLASVPIRDAP
jgi:hypothetical protein